MEEEQCDGGGHQHHQQPNGEAVLEGRHRGVVGLVFHRHPSPLTLHQVHGEQVCTATSARSYGGPPVVESLSPIAIRVFL